MSTIFSCLSENAAFISGALSNIHSISFTYKKMYKSNPGQIKPTTALPVTTRNEQESMFLWTLGEPTLQFCLNKRLPGCNGLLLLCTELVLDDLDDLLLVGRLLLPVEPKTGGSTAVGGTYTESEERMVVWWHSIGGIMFVVRSEVELPFPAWWRGCLFPPSAGSAGPEAHACAWW